MSGALGVVGGVAGAAIGASISAGNPLAIAKGAAIGSTVGAFLDALTMPSVRNDPRWVGTSYGNPIPRGWGEGRTPSQIVWALRNPVDGSYIFENDSFKAKIKGTTNHYLATFAFLGPETAFTYLTDGTQVERTVVWDRIWMADKIVWQNSTAVPIDEWVSTTTYEFGDLVTRLGTAYTSLADENVDQDPHISTTQWWKVASDYSDHVNITFHPGTGESVFTQAVDSTIATHEGISNTPAFRGLNYAVVQDMDLYGIGNTVPQDISIEWHYANTPTYADVFSDICGTCGLKAADYNFAGADSTLSGFVQKARGSGGEVLNVLLGAGAFDLVQVDGVIQVVPRGGASAVTIPDGDLAAHFSGETPPERVECEILVDTLDLHTQVQVGYCDQTVSYRDANETVVRNVFTAPNPVQMDTGLVLTPTQAAQMAGRLLDTEWLEAGREYRISLPGSYAYLAPTDIVTFNDSAGVSRRFRIVAYEENHGLIKLRCVRDEIDVLNRFEVGDDGQAAYQAPTMIVPTKAAIASPANDFTDQFAAYPGVYVWANGGPGWQGTQVMFTFDAPTAPSRNWVQGPFIGTASAFGSAAASLADASAAGYETSDSVNVVLDIASAMMLASTPEASVNNENAWALLGNEILGVAVVSQVSSNTWTLGPGLVRGLRGSPYTGHASGEQFAIAPSTTQTTKFKVGAQYVGQTCYVQCLSVGESVGDAPELSCVVSSPIAPWTSSIPTSYQETPSGAVNGTNTVFTLTYAPVVNSMQLYVAGVPVPNTGFTLSRNTLTLSVAPASGASIYCYYTY